MCNRALPVSFRGDTKNRRSLLSGVYARGSKTSHQSALECVTVVDSTTLRLEKDNSKNNHVTAYNTQASLSAHGIVIDR